MPVSDAARTRWPRAPATLPRWTAAAEVVSVFVLIVFYAWGLRGRGPFVGVIVLLVLLSHAWRRETPAVLGFRSTNFGRCVVAFGPVVAAVAALIVAEARGHGALAHGWPGVVTPARAFGVLVGYCAWGLVQQWALCGYFFNRLAYAFGAVRGGSWLAALAAAACFAAAHLPNAYLVGPTFVLGFLCALGYRKYRNLVFLGLAHGVLGTLLVLLVASALPQGLRTGPGAGPAARVTGRRR